ncbi:MAG: mechanosensitive ion channel family protein [Chlorobium sp.]|uniref:mechanosensitive ion channel family protein n=1 Tax=Chlorobium sp. TaxID=1095 RepID=UPI0025BC47AB|nr:mechanosensitive ion channel family protein [Chlorobium sp.]MCF8217018.1 mechanosensitive ion channel family protein [Chlorobium sp.]MCF8271848.1 mechanosensitive ion channel family protein [Chlorobium sp.]MCF8288235.1 mechanosensitive ion channel family protein [Chlorobium sp.]MCF8291816.1 mechanosensitive ion channel family protein [Chlorobium sp.]MCF8385918.1 mechanosensitive ion channel family protein [Chlorobium sp.]
MKPVSYYLQEQGFSALHAEQLATLILVASAIVLVVVAEIVTKKILLKAVSVLTRKTSSSLDDLLLKYSVFRRVAHMVPPVLLYNISHAVLIFYPDLIPPVQTVITIYLTVIAVFAILGALDALLDFYNEHPASARLPLKSFVQVLKTIVVSSGAIIVIAKLLGTSPLVFFSGLGAFTAVIILIFKDSILGFVAGLQLTTNNLVQTGDWIEMPKYGADGEITDISLVTVSVQNWDKTITVIPAYALISEGFKNWRGMSESGARRITRSITIDMRSVRFCDDAMLEKMRGITLIRDYLEAKTRELDEYNRKQPFYASVPVNGRRLTNIGTFRAYVVAYLRSHPKINSDMTLLVRHLQPAENGLPIQLYVFCNDVVWAHYEDVQADIMDHLLAVLPFFDLRVFQSPSGADISEAVRNLGRIRVDDVPKP